VEKTNEAVETDLRAIVDGALIRLKNLIELYMGSVEEKRYITGTNNKPFSTSLPIYNSLSFLPII
jgi:hypothetical protein